MGLVVTCSIAAFFFGCCGPSPVYYLRDLNTGLLSEPFSMKNTEIVRVGDNRLQITQPRPGALDTIDKLKSIDIRVNFDGAPLPKVVGMLNRAQEESVGTGRNVPISLFVGASWLNPQEDIEQAGDDGSTNGFLPELPQSWVAAGNVSVFQVLRMIQMEMKNRMSFCPSIYIEKDSVILGLPSIYWAGDTIQEPNPQSTETLP